MANETPKLFYLYRITNLINNKIYIGQSISPRARWYQHKNDASKDSPPMVITQAIKKYGNENFSFEIIATCKNQDNANDLETILVFQNESHISTGKGYNVSYGGMNAPKTEAWRQQMRNYWADPEYKAKVSSAISKTHMGMGHTEETRKLLSIVRSGAGNSNWGKKQSEETISKRVAKNTGKKRTDEQKKRIKDSAVNRVMPIRIIVVSQQENEIRTKFANGIKQRALAREYNLSREVVARILGFKRKNKIILAIT